MNLADNIRIVLVETSHPGNIGASARAMKNMGLSQLVLVQPRDFPSGVAVGRAASAQDVLESARVVDSLPQAIGDCALVIGTSARSRSIPWPMLDGREAAAKVVTEARERQVALVFGREDSGLNNEELQMCHYHLQLPANPGYSSLNLAAAVMVICYEIFVAAEQGDDVESDDDYWDQPRATTEQVEHFYAHLERVMVAIDFHDPENPRQLMQRLRRLFGRTRLDEMELNVLRGILTNIEQRLIKSGASDS